MRTAALIVVGALSSGVLSACNPSSGETIDPNLQCAAMISAASILVSSGKSENDPALTKRALGSSMTYLNAYAIPKKIKEAEAFAQVKSLRATLLEKLPPAEIMSSAKRCANRNPR